MAEGNRRRTGSSSIPGEQGGPLPPPAAPEPSAAVADAAAGTGQKKRSKWSLVSKLVRSGETSKANKADGGGAAAAAAGGGNSGPSAAVGGVAGEVNAGVFMLGSSFYLNNLPPGQTQMNPREWRTALDANTMLRISFHGIGARSMFSDESNRGVVDNQRSDALLSYVNCRRRTKRMAEEFPDSPQLVVACLCFLKRDRAAFEYLTTVIVPELEKNFGAHLPIILIGCKATFIRGKGRWSGRKYMKLEEEVPHVMAKEGYALAEEMPNIHYLEVDLDTLQGFGSLAGAIVRACQMAFDTNGGKDGACSIM